MVLLFWCGSHNLDLGTPHPTTVKWVLPSTGQAANMHQRQQPPSSTTFYYLHTPQILLILPPPPPKIQHTRSPGNLSADAPCRRCLRSRGGVGALVRLLRADAPGTMQAAAAGALCLLAARDAIVQDSVRYVIHILVCHIQHTFCLSMNGPIPPSPCHAVPCHAK